MKARVRLLVTLCLLLMVWGCGGGGGDASTPPVDNPDPGPFQPAGLTEAPDATSEADAELGTARFAVDVVTGQVDVTTLAPPGGSGRAIFTGTAVGFRSSTLLDQPGAVGLKALSVRIVNQWALPIGQQPDGTVTGLRVLFSPFTNLSGPRLDVRSRVRVSTLAGTGTATSVDGAPSAATFNQPIGVAVGRDGSIYVSELAGNRVRRIQAGRVSLLAGNGEAISRPGLGASASVNQPYGIAPLPDGAVVVCEYGGARVSRVSPEGSVTPLAGTGVFGSVDGPGDTARFRCPAGVTVDAAGVIYVAEEQGHSVRRIRLTGADPTKASSYTVSTLAGGAAGFAEGSGTSARFNLLTGLVAGGDGALYVTDYNNHRVRRVSLGGEVVTIAGDGVAANVDGVGSTARLNRPLGLAWTPRGIVVAQADGRLRLLTRQDGAPGSAASNWLVRSLAGTGSSGFTDGAGDVARFNLPWLLAADDLGSVYVADRLNQRIRRLSVADLPQMSGEPAGTPPAEPVQLSNADGRLPGPDGTTVPFIEYQWYDLQTPRRSVLQSGAESPGELWAFVVPEGVRAFEFTVTVEAATPVLAPPEAGTGVGSANVVVRTIAGSAGEPGFVDGVGTAARFKSPRIAVDAAGVIYSTDFGNQAIRRIEPNGRVSTIAGSVKAEIGTADGLGHEARFHYPHGIAVNADGTVLYVADFYSSTVRRLALSRLQDPRDAASWTVATIAGVQGDTVCFRDGDGVSARFYTPQDVMLSNTGDLYVLEKLPGRIRRLRCVGGDPMDPQNWDVRLVAGYDGAALEQTGTADGRGNAARFTYPFALDGDASGNLYVADNGNSRVRRITPDGVATTFAGPTGGAVAAYADGAAGVARFEGAEGIAVDQAGYIYVGSGSRLRRISPGGVVSTVAGTGQSTNLDGPGNTATFRDVASVAVDAAGVLYVASEHCIRRVDRVVGMASR